MRPEPRVRVLVAEKQANAFRLFQTAFSDLGWEVTACFTGVSAVDAIRSETFDVVLTELDFPDVDGISLLREVRAQPSPAEVIILAAESPRESAVAAVRLGAYGYLSTPYEMTECALTVRRSHQRRLLGAENALLRERLARLDPVEHFVAEAAAMQTVLDFLASAPEESPVLIVGDRGTGKSTLARVMHRRSDRRSMPFLDFDCSTAEPSSLEGRLFGCEKPDGSAWVRTFDADSIVQVPGTGLLELASGGTICLDEVGMLDGNLQARLYSALESEVFHRSGGTQRVRLQARLVATSRTSLESQVAAGSFNTGLYHYLNSCRVSLPRLRERTADLPLLAEHFVRVFGGLNPPRLTAGAIAALRGYRWPGNLSELRAVMERTVLLARGRAILDRDIMLANAAVHAVERLNESSSLDEVERNVIARALAQTGWHRGRAAEILGVSPKTLWRKIRRYGFSRPASARALASESRERE